MSASAFSTYGHSLWLTRHSVHFYPTFTYCCHPFFSPSCQPASTQLLLPWRHLISWHMNQSHHPAPPSSPSLTNSLFSSSHLSLCSVRVHPVHPFLRTANYLRVAEGSDSVKSLGACRCQHTWLTVTVLVVTCGSDPEIGFITCSLSFTEKKSMKATTEREAILQMPGPFECLACSGPLNWHMDWTHAGQKLRPVATGNRFDGLGSKDGISLLGETDEMTSELREKCC